jgi:hypothetical protein
MAAGDGRNQVLTDTTIAVDWGNAIADRTVQSYPDQNTRDAQWVAPRPGAVCYTAAEDEFWIMVSGAWNLLPYGYISHDDGPDSLTTVHGTYVVLAQVNFTSRAGRVYQFNGHAAGTQVTKGGSGFARLMMSTSFGTSHYVTLNDPALGDVIAADLTRMARASTSGAAWGRISAMTTVSGGGVQFGAGGATVWVTDIGG